MSGSKPLFAVNERTYAEAELAPLWRRWQEEERGGLFPSREEGPVAICLADAAELLALILYVREQGRSALLLHSQTPRAAAEKLAAEAGCSALLYGTADEGASPVAAAVERGESKAAEEGLMMFSSGTSGQPKLIHRGWSDIDQEIESYNEALALVAGPDTTPVILSPVSHAYGLICGVLASMKRGVCPHMAYYTNPKLTLRLLRSFPKHLVYGVPMTLHVLSSLAGEQRFDKLMSSGAALPQKLLEQLRAQVDGGVYQQYGCSEAGCLSVSGPLMHVEDIGRPLKHLELVAAEGTREHPVELCFRMGARQVATGDIGYREERSGSLRLLGRADDIINTGGLKVYPAEVEEVIASLTEVRECVVYRVNHPVMGEQVACQAVLEPGHSFSAEAIRTYCMAHLAPYKVPSQVQLVDKLPRGLTGKLSRRQLEEEHIG
ncbi:AMP-binding protein [Paenibacillus sp. YYML68]|uniref:AMP-binding protein n=1 Tax=Paenibacillus sp. YYML68 TaxID=2909250 RepID=UPI0024918DED|nr:AMP-binding protein [Paenibacillus sp. YYML68]